MISRRSLFLGAAGLLCAPAIVRAQAAKVTIAMLPGLSYAPLLIAKNRRLLEAATGNVEVEWKTISSSAAIREAMLAGDVQVGAGSVAPFLIGRDRGFKVKAVSVLNRTNLWLVTNDPAITSVKDFKPEQKIAVPAPDTNQAFVLRKLAEQAFGNARALDANMLAMPHPDALQAIITNQIAGYVSSPPFQSQAVARGARKIADSKTAFGDLPFAISFATEKFGEARPDVVKALQGAIAQSIELARKDPGAAGRLIAGDFGGRMTPEEAARLLQDPDTDFTDSTAGIEALAAFMKQTGFLRTAVSGIGEVTFRF
ncbi:MAG: hypothetical protein B7Y12_08285 [Rhizobiales bacterium 24-66-13]|jgi:NitT/TauT family transport system substrate-binding protein|nr:MAG: hypothetical protein B7Y61_04620 [Rhizobiales bacterium 35-66-30]OYZ79855.1 MAG: hypothetical protein B7Y12_08285 [Rhizobiales bacterium 24-66-13]OZB07913.1 MAG: hypothetical protein B7X67_08320 [Rhizobiales bacterium 39-66-18]